MYFTIVTKYVNTGEVKGYSHYSAEKAIAELIKYRDDNTSAVHDILVVTDKFYAGDDVDMSIFDREQK